jgi:hypothetical protein
MRAEGSWQRHAKISEQSSVETDGPAKGLGSERFDKEANEDDGNTVGDITECVIDGAVDRPKPHKADVDSASNARSAVDEVK